MKVKLSHARNPDVRGGYWSDPAESGKARFVEVDSWVRASAVCREYIERNGLGAGNWTGGKVFDGKAVVAVVSYNGKVREGSDLDLDSRLLYQG